MGEGFLRKRAKLIGNLNILETSYAHVSVSSVLVLRHLENLSHLHD